MSEKKKLFIIQEEEYRNFDYQVSSVDISQIKEARGVYSRSRSSCERGNFDQFCIT